MISFKKVFKYLIDDDVELRVRMLQIILFCVFVGTVIGLIPMLIGKTSGWWLNILLMIITMICQILNSKYQKRDTAAMILAVTATMFVIPMMYFKQGGLASGMPLWMFFCTMIAFIMLEGWRRYLILTLSIIIYIACIITEFFFPETVVPLANKTAIFTDVIISFSATLIILLIILDIYLRAYNRKREQLNYALQYDVMSGVENRYAYENYIRALDAADIPTDLIIVSADVNGLKTVNDTLGHSAGDELLSGAAQVMTRAFGQYGKVFRTGGDEFQAIIFTEESLQKINEDFQNYMEEWHGETLNELHISVGYAENKEFKTDKCTTLIHVADKNMYRNKSEYYKKRGINRRIN